MKHIAAKFEAIRLCSLFAYDLCIKRLEYAEYSRVHSVVRDI